MVRQLLARAPTFLLVSIGVTLASCESSESSGSANVRDMARQAGFTELPLASVDAEGHVDFFLGKDVLAEYLEAGSFLATDEKRYSMIRFPASLVDQAQRLGVTTTWPLCDPTADITLVHNDIGDVYHAPPPDQVANCSPWVEHYDGRLRIEYTSGQPGVYGFAQIGTLPNGNLFAGAVMDGALPSACEGDSSITSSFMRLGTFVPNGVSEVVRNCHAPERER